MSALIERIHTAIRRHTPLSASETDARRSTYVHTHTPRTLALHTNRTHAQSNLHLYCCCPGYLLFLFLPPWHFILVCVSCVCFLFVVCVICVHFHQPTRSPSSFKYTKTLPLFFRAPNCRVPTDTVTTLPAPPPPSACAERRTGTMRWARKTPLRRVSAPTTSATPPLA